jgi:hypothetical protein
MDSKNQSANTQNILIVAVLITAVAVVGLFLYREGSTATVVISPTNQDGQVFVDQTRPARLTAEATTTIQVDPGTREILISGQHTYPWKKRVSVAAGSSTTVYPFLISQNSRQTASAPKQVKKRLDSQAQNPQVTATTSGGRIRVIVAEDGRLGARWQAGTSSAPGYFSCSESRCQAVIFDNSSRPAQQVSAYPGHPKAVIFATNSGVYALEIDPSGETQNFQPIVQDAQDPHFVIANDRIFVRSNNQITTTRL